MAGQAVPEGPLAPLAVRLAAGVPMVSLDVPLAPAAGQGALEPVVGSFSVGGMTFAVVGEGEAMLVAVGPDARPAAGGASGAPTSLAVPASVGHAGISYSVASVGPGAFASCDAAEVSLPASVSSVDPGALAGPAVERVEVDASNPSLASSDGALYDEGLSCLLSVPGGRKGAVRIPESAASVAASAFSHCAGVAAIEAAAGSPSLSSFDGALYSSDLSTLLRVAPAAERASLPAACSSAAPGALEGCHALDGADRAAIEALPASQAAADAPLASVGQAQAYAAQTYTVHGNGGYVQYIRGTHKDDLVKDIASDRWDDGWSLSEYGKDLVFSRNEDKTLNTWIWTYRKGYTHQGWSATSTGTLLPQGATCKDWGAHIYAMWRANTYTLDFDLDGGTGSGWESYRTSVTFDSAVPAISTAKPTRYGYTFTGWYTEGGSKGTKVYDASCQGLISKWPFDEGATLYAGWTPNTYGLLFNANGGTGWEGYKATATFGQPMPAISTAKPTRTGYAFTGWYISGASDAAQYYDANCQGVRPWNQASAATLYAHWAPNAYTVEYWKRDGSAKIGSDDGFRYDTARALASAPGESWISRGHTAVGWSRSANQSTADFALGSSQKNLATSGTVKLYLVEQANTYRISFDANGGSGGQSSAVTATYGQTMPAISTTKPTRTGYAFTGWYADRSTPTSSNVYYTAECKAARPWNRVEDTTLYAHWQANPYTVEYWSKDGKTKISSDSGFKYDADRALMTKPTSGVSAGHLALGWSRSTGQSRVDFAFGSSQRNLAAEGTVKLYLAETPNTYGLAFNPNGGTGWEGYKATATYGQPMPAISTQKPVRPGYVFTGWYLSGASDAAQYYDANCQGVRAWDQASAATLWAHWQAATYGLTFNLDGGSGEGWETYRATVTYGAPVPQISTFKPWRRGHAFTGWYTEGGSKGTRAYDENCQGLIASWPFTEGATLYAGWTANTYRVSFDANGGSGGQSAAVTATYAKDMPAISTERPAKPGYAFLGWYADKDAPTDGSCYYTAECRGARPWNRVEDTVLYAHWRANAYAIAFDAQGGEACDAVAATYDANVALPSTKRTGYAFRGWDTEPDGTGIRLQAGMTTTPPNLTTRPDAMATLYAQWAAVVSADVPVTATVTLDLLGAEPQGPGAGWVESRCGEPLAVAELALEPLAGAATLFGDGADRVSLEALAEGAVSPVRLGLGAECSEADPTALAPFAMASFGDRVAVAYGLDVPGDVLASAAAQGTLEGATTPVARVAYTVALA